MASTTTHSDEQPLFSSTLLPTPSTLLPPGYNLRPLLLSDYHRGFLTVLRTLTKVGDISFEAFAEQYKSLASTGDYYIVVVTSTNDVVVAVGSLIVEKKFIRNLSRVGHIEDIAVLEEEQGKKLGKRVIETLDGLAVAVGCYKSILDCAESKRGFYEKCGFKLAGIQMSHYYDGETPKDAPKPETKEGLKTVE